MAPGDIAEDEIADLLDRLVAKSLIAFDDQTSRYRCLETVRQYAREQQLARFDAGGEPDHRPKHAKFFYDLITNQEQPSSAASLAKTEADYENMRQALDWWAMQTQDDEALQMASAMYAFWYARGLLREGSDRLRALLQERANNKNAAYGHALFCYADFTVHLGMAEEGKAAFEEAMLIGEQSQDRKLQALALSGLAGVYQDHLVHYELSRKYRLQALELADYLPNGKMHAARHYYNLGDLVMKSHPDLESERRQEVLLEARSHFEKAAELSKSESDSRLTYFLCAGLGGVSLHLGDVASAKKYALEGLRYSIDSGYTLGQAANLALLAFCAETVQAYEPCVTLFGGGMQIVERTGFTPGAKEVAVARQVLDTCIQHLGEEAYERSLEQGKSMSAEQLFSLAAQSIPI